MIHTMIQVLYKIFTIFVFGCAISFVAVIFYLFWIAFLLFLRNKKNNEDFTDWFI